jgi:hypothetical protein
MVSGICTAAFKIIARQSKSLFLIAYGLWLKINRYLWIIDACDVEALFWRE